MKLSYDATWQSMTAMMRAHADLILVIAGAFILLPTLAQAIYFPAPGLNGFNAAAFETLLAYYQSSFIPVFLVRLATLVGTGTLLCLLLRADRPTVGDAIKLAARLLPTLFLVDVLTQIITAIGLIAFVVPGLYLIARTALATPVVMAETMTRPLKAVGRSFALTQGLGWQILGLIVIVMVVMWIGTAATMTVLGVLARVLLPDDAATIAHALLGAFTSTILMLTYTLLSAGLYRQITGLKSGM